MKIALAVLMLLSVVGDVMSAQRVRGYTRKDGTYVQPHYKSDRDNRTDNNYSTEGNYNPYTGEEGTKKRTWGYDYDTTPSKSRSTYDSDSYGSSRKKTKSIWDNEE